MSADKTASWAVLLAVLLVLNGCGSTPPPRPAPSGPPSVQPPPARSYFQLSNTISPSEIVLYTMGLLDTGYRFGGRNPEAGLDCSGMVSYVVEQVSGRRLPHNAAQIAGITRPIARERLAPGDLVFFNTTGLPYSHMGIYLGEGRFVHAPSTNGRVRVERMDNRYFATRFTAAHTLF